MSQPPSFPLYGADFRLATDHWSNAEVGAYLRLLIHQWEHGSIPSDQRRLARIVGESIEDFCDLWKTVGPKFAADESGVLRNTRLERVRDERTDFIRQKADAGRRSGEARRRQKNERETNETGTPVERTFIARSNGDANGERTKHEPPVSGLRSPIPDSGLHPPTPLAEGGSDSNDVRANRRADAGKAWGEILRQHGRTDDPIGMEALRSLGGWSVVGFAHQDQVAGFERRFKSAYRSLSSRTVGGSAA